MESGGERGHRDPPARHALAGEFARRAPDFRGLQLIEGAGHWVQFEAPEAFDAALRRALEE